MVFLRTINISLRLFHRFVSRHDTKQHVVRYETGCDIVMGEGWNFDIFYTYKSDLQVCN